jgi:hypothetical protein
MKVRIRKVGDTGETLVEFLDNVQAGKVRFNLLKNIIYDKSDVTLIVDTNQRVLDKTAIPAENYLAGSGIMHKIIPVDANRVNFFGIPMRIPQKKSESEKLFIMNISTDQFTEELYRFCLENYDLTMGFGRKKTWEETCVLLGFNNNAVLSDLRFFEDRIYDSIVCSVIRSSFDIRKYVEAATNENAI